jgi:hypothetical protein
MVYLQRTTRPSWLKAVAEEFDQLALDAASVKLKLPALTDRQQQQLRLKLRNGGLGLPSVVTTSPIAFSAGFMSAAALLNDDQVLGQTDLIAGSSLKAAVESAMQDTRSQLDPQSDAHDLLPPEETFDDANCQVISWIVNNAAGADTAERKLQFTLAAAADQRRADALLKRTSKVEAARLRATRAPHAAAWLRATPADAASRLSNQVFSAAVRQRLGLSHTDDTLTGCVCGKDSSKPEKKTFDPSHDLSCIKFKQSDVTLRHDSVKVVLNKWLHRLNVATHMEHLYAPDSQERADIIAAPPDGRDYVIDVAVTSATCPSAIKKGSASKTLAAATAVVNSKKAKYRQNLAGSGEELVAFVAEADGGLHDEATNFIKQLAKLTLEDNSCGWTQSEAFRAVICEIAVAIQKGNHRITRHALRINRHAGFVISKDQAEQPGDDSKSFYGDDRDMNEPPQSEQQQRDDQQDALNSSVHEHTIDDAESASNTELVLLSVTSRSPSQPDHAQNLNYNEDDHDDISPVFPSPNAGKHAALRVASQLLDSEVQIDASIIQLLQSPSQRDALREQGVELPLQLPQHGQPDDDLGELNSSILRSPERAVIRDGGVVLPFNEAASEAAEGASRDAPLEVDP